MKQVLGCFEVTNGSRRPLLVVVSQETFLDGDDLIVNARKVYTLNDEYGEEVWPTMDEFILRKEDGSELKRTGNIVQYDLQRIHNNNRRGRH